MNQEGISHSSGLYTAFEGIAVFGKAGETVSCNARMEQILGRTAEEVPSLERMLEQFFAAEPGDITLGMDAVRACSGNGSYVRVRHPREGDRWCRVALSDGEDGSLAFHCLDCSSDKAREDALCKEERKFRSLFEESRDAISFYGPPTVVNQAWLDLFGYSPEEMADFDPTRVYANPEDRVRFLRELEEQGFVKDYEVVLRKKDGSKIDCLYTTTAYRDENGALCVRGVVRDVTDLKRTISAQRESEEKFRSLFEESKDAIGFIGPRERTANQAWLDLFGYTSGELNDLDIRSLYANPGDRERFERELETRGFVRDYEERLRRKDGEIIDCVSTARVHRSEDGGIRYYQSILRDITPMRRMIRALRESEEKYRHLVENIQEVIYSVDTLGVITYISPVIETLSGYSARDLIGKALADVHYVYPPDLSKVRDAFRNTAPGKPNFHEFRFLARNGEILWFSASVYAVVRDGEVTGFQGILVDVSKNIQAKRELRESEERMSRFLDSATDAFLLFDPYLNLVDINHTARKEFSLRERDVLGVSLSVFLKTICYPGDPLAFIEVLNSGEPSAIKDIPLGESSFDFKVFRVGYGLGIIATNTTEQKRAERELRQARADLEKRVAERTADLEKANEDLERQIMERKEAERVLRESEERFRTFFENAGVALLEMDITRFRASIGELQSRGVSDFEDYFTAHPSLYREIYRQIRVTDFNHKAVAIYDAVTREQLLTSFSECMADDRLPCLVKLAQCIAGSRTSMAMEFEGMTLSNRKRFVQVNITLPLHPERFDRVLVSVTDLTERKQFEDALRAARDTLEERVRERTEILARTNLDLEREIMERESAERALQFYSGFQQRISSISTDFINLPAREIDRGVIHALQIIGEFTGADRGFVFRVAEDIQECVLTHEWCAPGIPDRPGSASKFTREYGRVLSALKCFEIVHVPSLFGFPEEAEEERRRYESLHVQSFIVVPMIRGGGLVGAFGFETLRREHAWDIESFPLLKLMGEMLVNALERNNVERRIMDYQEKLRSIASELTLTEERERRRIAVELHDRIGQPLAVSRIRLGVLKGQLPPGDSTKTIDDVNAFIGEAIGDTRSLIFEISPPILYDLGLEPALEWLVETVQQQHGIITEFHGDGRKQPLDHNLRVLLFQSVRELLVNVVKHALARRVTVTLESGDAVVDISVEDDGIGFDVGIIETRSMRNIGFGLFSIRERLEHLGGGFWVESKSGVGTTVKLSAPVNREIQT